MEAEDPAGELRSSRVGKLVDSAERRVMSWNQQAPKLVQVYTPHSGSEYDLDSTIMSYTVLSFRLCTWTLRTTERDVVRQIRHLSAMVQQSEGVRSLLQLPLILPVEDRQIAVDVQFQADVSRLACL